MSLRICLSRQMVSVECFLKYSIDIHTMNYISLTRGTKDVIELIWHENSSLEVYPASSGNSKPVENPIM